MFHLQNLQSIHFLRRESFTLYLNTYGTCSDILQAWENAVLAYGPDSDAWLVSMSPLRCPYQRGAGFTFLSSIQLKLLDISLDFLGKGRMPSLRAVSFCLEKNMSLLIRIVQRCWRPVLKAPDFSGWSASSQLSPREPSSWELWEFLADGDMNP